MMFLRRWRSTQARIVLLGVREAPRIAELHATAFARPWSTAEVESLMLGRGMLALGARLGSALAGMALVRVAADEAELLTIAVAADWQGCGLARRMLDDGLDRGAGLGATVCHLEVEAGNSPALALYRRLGFVEVGRRRGYYAAEGGGDALRMSRGLADRVPRLPPPDAVEFPAERQ